MIYFRRIENLSSIGPEIPFNPKRIYWIKTRGQNRGNHAHKKLMQVITCIQGYFTLVVDNNRQIKEYKLCGWNPEGALITTEWHSMKDCSEDCIILVAASDFYKEADYIRNKKDWRKFLDGTLQKT